MEDMHAFFRSRRLLLAPMAGVSDEAFRTLCREQGADLTYTEMVSAKGLSYANEKTRHLLRLAPGEGQVAVQLFGHEPVTVKFRRGWAEGDETAPEFARRMEDAGACAIAVHGRYAEQLYRGRAEWGAIARVKEAVSVPVVGNGDVRSGADAVAITERTGCACRRGKPLAVRPGQGCACGRAGA